MIAEDFPTVSLIDLLKLELKMLAPLSNYNIFRKSITIDMSILLKMKPNIFGIM